MRCFVACFVETDSAQNLQGAVASSWQPPDGLRLVPTANYHVTLKFLGQLAANDVPGVLEAVDALGGGPLRGRVLGLGGFPRAEGAYVVYARLEPRAELRRWAGALSGLAKVEERVFVPHVTVARSRRRVLVPGLETLNRLILELRPPALYQSVSVPGGVRYRPVDNRPGNDLS